jgi:putative sigma-54 modulation protein
MRTFVRGTNVKVTETMKSYAEERIQRLGRHAPFVREATLVYSVQRAWHIAEVTVRFSDTIMRAEERSNDMYVSVDKAIDKIEQQVRRLKGRMEARRHEARERGEVDQQAEELAEILGEIDDDSEGIQPLGDGDVVKIKTYALRPMSTDEALLQMQLVDHDFFVFAQDGGEVNVLYRRRDGDYGLLVPDNQRQ